MPPEKSIAIITAGGSIYSGSHSGDAKKNGIAIEGLLGRLGYTERDGIFVSGNDGTAIRVISLFDKVGMHITADDRMSLAKKAHDLLLSHDGIIITHDTDSLAITAHDLALWMHNPLGAITITGVRKNPADEYSEACANIHNAIVFTRDGVCGVFVVSNGQVLDSAGVFEYVDPQLGPQTFESVYGPVAYIEDYMIEYVRQQPGIRSPHALPGLDMKYNSNVVMLNSMAIERATLAEQAKGKDGVVIKPGASGALPVHLHAVVRDVAKRKAVVISQSYVNASERGAYDAAYAAVKLGAAIGSAAPFFDLENLRYTLGCQAGKNTDPLEAKRMFIRNKEALQFMQLQRAPALACSAANIFGNVLRGLPNGTKTESLKVGNH
ncbi:MAG: asparaginase domain-containing protein [Candidatus Marsarchaeota archaeon]|nr:asparaginase domain-containing protein [Candidatus Marsarchaeota archaeon]